jgi:hypothetical protein
MKIAKLSSKKKKQLELSLRGRVVIVEKVSDAFDEARKYVSSGVAVLQRGDGSFVVERLDMRRGGVVQGQAFKDAKQLKAANKHRRDVGFSRGATVLREAESLETTAQIAESVEKNLARHRDTYKLLFEKAAKRR